MSHTPGPWFIFRSDGVWSISTHDKVQSDAIARGGGDPYIAGIWADEDNVQASADARLISAAPDLYEALIKVKLEIEELYNALLDCYCYTHFDSDGIDAALAKARGETN